MTEIQKLAAEIVTLTNDAETLDLAEITCDDEALSTKLSELNGAAFERIDAVEERMSMVDPDGTADVLALVLVAASRVWSAQSTENDDRKHVAALACARRCLDGAIRGLSGPSSRATADLAGVYFDGWPLAWPEQVERAKAAARSRLKPGDASAAAASESANHEVAAPPRIHQSKTLTSPVLQRRGRVKHGRT